MEDLRTWWPLAPNSLPAMDITNSAPGVNVRAPPKGHASAELTGGGPPGYLS